MKILQVLHVFLTLVTAALAVHPFDKLWENTDYQKSIDVSKSFIKERHDIEIKNIGSQPASTYIFALPRPLKEDISLLVALSENPKGKKSLMKSTLMISDFSDELIYYTIDLPYPISPNSNFKFAVSLILTNQMVPYPEHIPMDADQFLKISTNLYPLTPYDTLSYTFGIIGGKSINNINNDDEFIYPLEREESHIDNILLKSIDTIPDNAIFDYTFTFMKNKPLTFVNYLKRDLWVSHWSSALQLEEYYEVTNHGAKLDKGFSRGEYLSKQIALKQHHSISAFRIPFDQSKDIQEGSIYYVDKVGNVSTSQFYNDELIVRPRFPLFGGWNYNFTIGWNYDLKQFLKQENDEYILSAHILDGIRDATYSNVSFNIYLPEGAELIDYGLPFSSNDPLVSYELSYLDIEDGHLKISFEFENLIDEMKNLEIVLRYRYTTFNMFEKPLKTALYIFFSLMGLYILKKIDLTIKPTKQDEVLTSEEDEK